jgi:hypothetical protein
MITRFFFAARIGSGSHFEERLEKAVEEANWWATYDAIFAAEEESRGQMRRAAQRGR